MTKDKLNIITASLFNTKTEKDCLRMINGKLSFNGKILDQKQREAVISQAKTIRNMDLYTLLINDLKVAANKKLYFDCKNEYDILYGKAVLWTIDVLEQKVDNLARL